MKQKVSATKIGIVLAAALLATGCEDKKEDPAKAPEKAPAATEKKGETGSAAAPAEKKDTVAAKEGEAAADEKKDGEAKDGEKKGGKEGSCGEGSCG